MTRLISNRIARLEQHVFSGEEIVELCGIHMAQTRLDQIIRTVLYKRSTLPVHCHVSCESAITPA